eukprot:TRINITY_DN46360_c0_g1_i1.p1 TRINITY_DN46360_c0_g1~~TRINITY_DN46360_c0_g1_i1.p1  ORF type:complete len:190 (-),score=31.34 TRINITY_DN46360_c0_g1_i1:197-766(-)
MAPALRRARSQRVRAPMNPTSGRISQPMVPEVAQGWTPHWGTGRYFSPKLAENIKELRGEPFPEQVTIARSHKYDGATAAKKRASEPQKVEKNKEWVKDCGRGAYFRWHTEERDVAIRGDGPPPAAIERCYDPPMRRSKSSPPEKAGGFGGSSWRRPQLNGGKCFHPFNQELGLQDCEKVVDETDACMR